MKILPFLAACGCLTLFAGLPLRAEEKPATPPPHPVEVKAAELLKDATSTADMREAMSRIYGLWDAEMNRAYQELRGTLPATAAAKLKTAQQQWLVFRDAEFAALDEQYRQFQGTIFLLHRDSARLRVIEDRARALGRMLDLQQNPGG